LVIFDQFEEYFLYAPQMEAQDGFEAQFSRAVNREDVRANFLLSMREDSLSKLDRFKGRIRNVLGNTLRICHLDPLAAEESIRGPLSVYNQKFGSQFGEVIIEEQAVHAILAQMQTEKVKTTESSGVGRLESVAEDQRIETPFLQLVMTELWNAEMKQKSRILRSETFENVGQLGGARAIVRGYVNSALDLSPTDQEVCARVFRFLVTPDESKIALPVSILANWSDLDVSLIASVMGKLARGQNHILRIVESAAGQGGEPRYELFHDVLAGAILEWRKRYVQKREVQQARLQAATEAAETEKQASQKRELEQAKALAEEQKLRADAKAELAKRLRRGLVSVISALLVAVAALSYAIYYKKHAIYYESRANDYKVQAQVQSVKAAKSEIAAVIVLYKRSFTEERRLRASKATVHLQTRHPSVRSHFRLSQVPKSNTLLY
jgi:hypothetical protein